MPVQIHLNGQRYFADDGTDPAELQQYAQMHQQEQAQLNPMNQGMQNVFSGINRQIQQYNELPAPTVVPGNTYGMSSQAFNQTAGIIQQDNMNSATARMQQRVQMEQAMEQEKDRAQQIKLQQQQFKNQQNLENLRMENEKARIKAEMEGGSITTGPGGTQVYRGIEGGVPFARNIPIEGIPEVAPKIMPQQFVKTMDAAGNPVMRIATQEELQAGVPLYEKPEGGAGFTLSPGQTRFENGKSVASVPANEQSRSLTPTQTLNLELTAIRLVKEQRKDWFDNDRYSDTFGQVKPEFAGQFEAEVSRRVQAATGGVAPSVAPAPAQGAGVPTNPPMAREGFVNGKPALINDATGEYVLMDEAPITPTSPPVVDVAVPQTVPQQAPTIPPQQPLFDPFANPGILFRTPTLPAGSVTIPYQNQQRSYGTI